MEEATSLDDLPVECLASILSWLPSPAQVVRAGLVNKAFLEASNSDSVWENFLPPNWNSLVSTGSRRAVYDQLCAGVFIQENQIYYWLHQPTGGVCNILSARSLYIVWSGDERYWKWRPLHGSRFDEVAFLRAVCWLEIGGSFKGILRRGTYTVSFRLQLLRNREQDDDEWPEQDDDEWPRHAYGWDLQPVVFTVSTADGQKSTCSRFLTSSRDLNSDIQAGLENLAAARVVEDGSLMEYDAGKFEVEDEDSETEVSFSLVGTTGGNSPRGNWKGGMYVDGVVIKPSYLNP